MSPRAQGRGQGPGRTGGAADVVHYLHVSKAAGTQLRAIIDRLNERPGLTIRARSHECTVDRLPKGARYFFSVRDPADRFRSGFYSRKRGGKPQYDQPPLRQERRSFKHFPHANDLAEALFTDGERGRRAAMAMLSLRHAARPLAGWFKFQGFAFELRPPVWIVRTSAFDADVEELQRRLGVPGPERIRPGAERAHGTDYGRMDAPPLSDRARENLRRWYAQDYELMRVCEAWIEAERSRAPAEAAS